jgi:hypothetical protein
MSSTDSTSTIALKHSISVITLVISHHTNSLVNSNHTNSQIKVLTAAVPCWQRHPQIWMWCSWNVKKDSHHFERDILRCGRAAHRRSCRWSCSRQRTLSTVWTCTSRGPCRLLASVYCSARHWSARTAAGCYPKEDPCIEEKQRVRQRTCILVCLWMYVCTSEEREQISVTLVTTVAQGCTNDLCICACVFKHYFANLSLLCLFCDTKTHTQTHTHTSKTIKTETNKCQALMESQHIRSSTVSQYSVLSHDKHANSL